MAIASFIHRGASVADIGTDHGFLPVYLAQNGLARSIIASDISAGSLEAARRSATNYGVSDKITFIVAPGLSGIKETDVDTIVIAGLGGETIAAILNEAPWTRYSDIKLILQPQSKIFP
jgi:tRNA (adenine22-N1)-methyltransferase